MAEDKIFTLPEKACICLIGMPGAGKSVVGRALAARLKWGFLDTDYIMEAAYGVRLQDLADRLGKEAFLDVEETIILSVRANRVIIATGGSVVYRPKAMEYLDSIGLVTYLDVPLPTILERIARNPDRGLAIAPGQTVEDLFNERNALYTSYAKLTVHTERKNPEQCAAEIVGRIRIEETKCFNPQSAPSAN